MPIFIDYNSYFRLNEQQCKRVTYLRLRSASSLKTPQQCSEIILQSSVFVQQCPVALVELLQLRFDLDATLAGS